MEKEVQRRKKGKMLSTNTRKKKEKCDPLSTISVSSAWHLPEVLCFFFSPCPAQAQIKKKKRPASPSINWSQQYLSLSPHFLSAPPGTCSRFRPEKKEKCGRPSAISVNSAWHLPEVRIRKKKGSKATATTRQRQRDREETEKRQRRDREETEKRQRRDREETEKRQRRDREETEKRQRRDREVTEKWQRSDREETEKRQRRDREETEKRQRRDREETEKRQRRDREETEKRQRRDREETEKRQRDKKKKKERCGRPSTISLSSALHVFQVTTQKKRKVRSTLRNFCQLGAALARGSDPYQKKKKSVVDPPQFLEARPSTCSRFRPTQKKRKVRSTLRNFCQLGLAPARSSLVFFFALPCSSADKEKKKRPASPSINWSQQYLSLSPHFLSAPPGTCSRFRPEKKEKCGRPSAISVNSAWHLPEVLWFFFRLALRKHRKKKKTEASNPYLSLSPQSL